MQGLSFIILIICLTGILSACQPETTSLEQNSLAGNPKDPTASGIGENYPVFSAIASATYFVGSSINLDINDSSTGNDTDSDGDPITYSCYVDYLIDGLVVNILKCTDIGMNFDAASGVLSWPNLTVSDVGTYELKIAGSDSVHLSSLVFGLNIIGTPGLNYDGSSSAIVGVPVSISPSLLNTNGSSITGCYSTPTLPTGLSINASTCVISGTPTVERISTDYTIIAQNQAGTSAGVVVNITVNAASANHSPFFANIETDYYSVGEDLSIDVNDTNTSNDTDIDGQNITYSCYLDMTVDGSVGTGQSCISKGFDFNSSTGILSASSMTADYIGNYEVKVIGTDGALSSSVIFAISIYAADSGPKIKKLSGSAVDNSVIAISGVNFQNGPKIELFDDFEDGTAGSIIDLTNYTATYGQWDQQSQYYKGAFDGTESLSGNLSLDMWYLHSTPSTSRVATMAKFFDRADEFFTSFWIRVPNDSWFPGVGVTGPGMFSTDSSWKITWLMLGDRGDNTVNEDSGNDVYLPNHASGNGTFLVAGNNTSTIANIYDSEFSWWDWNHWIRISAWLKADRSDPLNNGWFKIQTLSEGKGLRQLIDKQVSVFHRRLEANNSLDVSPAVWDRIKFPGWARPSFPDKYRLLYDDVYIASGDNAQARVEVGNAASYEACTKLSILPIQTWGNKVINAIYKAGPLRDGDAQYLYITDSSGLYNAEGISLQE